MHRHNLSRFLAALMLLASLLVGLNVSSTAGAASDCFQVKECFPETGHSVHGKFLAYWQEHGGLAIYGYPLTEEMSERSDLNGKTYIIQYFERAEFEYHPENKAPYDVLLTQLGKYVFDERYPEGVSGDFPDEGGNRIRFGGITPKGIGGLFADYWESHGGLAQFGYPLTNEFIQDQGDGSVLLVQYFERAEFEYHPKNDPKYQILLSLLGKEKWCEKVTTSCMNP